MLKRYMHNRERAHWKRDDNRIVHPFGWGTEFVVPDANGDDPRKMFAEFSRAAVERSDDFFFSPEISDFRSEISDLGQEITWTSAVETPSAENNTAYAHYFPNAKNKKAAVVILPHWNAKARTYFDLARLFNRVGL